MNAILWLIAACLWGYIAGRVIAATLDWLQTNTRPIHIPLATALVDGLERGIHWYVHAIQDIVNGLSHALESAFRRHA